MDEDDRLIGADTWDCWLINAPCCVGGSCVGGICVGGMVKEIGAGSGGSNDEAGADKKGTEEKALALPLEVAGAVTDVTSCDCTEVPDCIQLKSRCMYDISSGDRMRSFRVFELITVANMIVRE